MITPVKLDVVVFPSGIVSSVDHVSDAVHFQTISLSILTAIYDNKVSSR